jgi:hypothetical protein
MARKKEFQIGDVIRRRVSEDEGRVVRIIDFSEIHPPAKGKRPKRIGYIVSLPANRHTSAKEALWREDEIVPADWP